MRNVGARNYQIIEADVLILLGILAATYIINKINYPIMSQFCLRLNEGILQKKTQQALGEFNK